MLSAAFEDLLRRVALGGVGDNSHDALAGAESRGNLHGGEDYGAGTRATEHALFAGEIADGAKGVIVRDHDDLVGERRVPSFGDEAYADAFGLMFAGRAALQNGALRLNGDSERFGVLLLYIAGDAGEGSAGPDTDDDGVHAAVHMLVDLAGGGLIVEVRIGLIF